MGGKLLILGAGASGIAAARLGAAEGFDGIMVSDQKPSQMVSGFEWADDLPEHPEGRVIVSPGIPSDHPWLKCLQKLNLEILPEFEFGAARLKGTQIAVTGSLGKTSMVLLAADLLRASGYKVTVSGNIGKPVSEIALEQPEADFHVIELSSFQLEITQSYRADRAVCLNLFPNHLDRHHDLQAYAVAKARLYKFQSPGDIAVWPAEYPVSVETAAERVEMDNVALPKLGNSLFRTSALRKNLQALFAGLDGIENVDAFRQERIIKNFPFPPHRLQCLQIKGAGKVVDDSKSTCLSASKAALLSISGPVQMILGGLDKQESFAILLPVFEEKNPQLYLFGHAAKIMAEAWQDSVDVCETYDTLDEVINALWPRRTRAETLLFSPGCASYDQYSGYEARGEHFQQLVRQLATNSPI